MNNRFRKSNLHLEYGCALSVAAAGLLMVCSSRGQSSQQSISPVTITVNSGRPLAEVLERVEQHFLSPINYEEAPYESPADLKTITVSQNGASKTLLARPISDFSVTLTDLDSSPYLAAQSVINSYISASLPGSYKVVQQDKRVDIVPTQVRGVSGSIRDVSPIMSGPVTFPSAERSVMETVQLIADAVSGQKGPKVLPLNVPFGMLETVELGADGETAGDVIENLGRALGRSLSYQCLYDATGKNYYLNLVNIASAPVPGGPPQHGLNTHPKTGPANSPFFVKQK